MENTLGIILLILGAILLVLGTVVFRDKKPDRIEQ